MTFELPDKLYFKIGEVAQLAEVPTHVLRYWESEFKGLRPKRTSSSQQRLYRREDVLLVLTIKSLLHTQGYTIAGAKKFLASGQAVSQPAPTIQTTKPATIGDMAAVLAMVKGRLLELQGFLAAKKSEP